MITRISLQSAKKWLRHSKAICMKLGNTNIYVPYNGWAYRFERKQEVQSASADNLCVWLAHSPCAIH